MGFSSLGHFFWTLFNWPNGIVVGNLLASVIWMWVIEKRMKVHHRRLKDALQKRETKKVSVGEQTSDSEEVR